MAKLDQYKDIATNLIERDRPKNIINRHMDAMWHNEWSVPDSLKDLAHVRPQINPGPHNAIAAGIRAYATMEPSLNLVRPAGNPADKERASKVENLLRYHYMRSAKRRGGTVTAEILKSAMLYDEVVAQVIHVDAQLALMGDVSENRKRAIRNRGNFIINVHNPQNVHVRYSDMVPEAVVVKKVQSIAEFSAFWGDKAKKVLSGLNDEKNEDNRYVVTFDYIDYDVRAVWGKTVATNVMSADDFHQAMDGDLVFMEEHDLPFLPWAAWSGASLLENRPEYQHHPLLYAVYKTDAWNEGNLADTLLGSEIISYASAPRLQIEGPSDNVDIDYGTPGNPAYVPPGHKLSDMQPPAFDQNLAMMSDRLSDRISQSTAPQIVISGDVPSGTAFATYNQALQSGLQTYAPYRELSERALEDIFCHMLGWAKYLNKPLRGPVKRRDGSMDYSGGGFVLDVNTYEYDEEITVNLKPDMPVDRQAQVNTASQAVQSLGWSQAYANEMLGENDPGKIFSEAALEAMKQTKVQGRLQIQQAEDQLQSQAILQGQADVLAAVQQFPEIADAVRQIIGQIQQQAQGGGEQPGQGPQPTPGAPQGLEGVEGSGFDANSGGQQPAPTNPGATRETQTGVDRQGNSV